MVVSGELDFWKRNIRVACAQRLEEKGGEDKVREEKRRKVFTLGFDFGDRSMSVITMGLNCKKLYISVEL